MENLPSLILLRSVCMSTGKRSLKLKLVLNLVLEKLV